MRLFRCRDEMTIKSWSWGPSINEAWPFSEEDENKLCGLWLFGDHSARILLNTMVFLMDESIVHVNLANLL